MKKTVRFTLDRDEPLPTSVCRVCRYRFIRRCKVRVRTRHRCGVCARLVCFQCLAELDPPRCVEC